MKMGARVALSAAILWAATGSLLAAEGIEPSRLVDRVVARAEAVISGRLEYRITNAEGKAGQHCRAVLSGPNWRLELVELTAQSVEVYRKALGDRPVPQQNWGGEAGFPIERINFGGKMIEVHRNLQLDGRVETSCQIDNPEAIDAALPVPPFFAGTIWYRKTLDYLRRHKSEARLAGEVLIDKTSTQVLQWDVPAAERYAALHMIDSRMDNGGKLRLYAAPALGYALPRIDYVAADGTVAKRFDSSDFQQVGPGLFMPKRCGYLLLSAEGKPAPFREQYEILRMEGVNEPIPEADFLTTLPEGTSVTDRRTVPATHFILGSFAESIPTELRDVLVVPGAEPASNTWRRAASLGVALGATVLCVLLVWLAVAGNRGRQPSSSRS